MCSELVHTAKQRLFRLQEVLFTSSIDFILRGKKMKSSHLDGHVNTICLAPALKHRQINNLFLKAERAPLYIYIF